MQTSKTVFHLQILYVQMLTDGRNMPNILQYGSVSVMRENFRSRRGTTSHTMAMDLTCEVPY